jgi:transposase
MKLPVECIKVVMACVTWSEKTKVACPQCGRPCNVYDRLPQRIWRHLSVMEYVLELRCTVPRCECPEHGVKTMTEPGSLTSDA